METNLPNLLTASSILLGIITALYGLFYPDIKNVIEIIPKQHKVDNKQNYIKSKNVFNGKYLPLMLGAIITTLIYLPELYKQILKSITVITTNSFDNVKYDTMTASFIAVCIFMLLITIMIIRIGFKMNNKIKKLNPKE